MTWLRKLLACLIPRRTEPDPQPRVFTLVWGNEIKHGEDE